MHKEGSLSCITLITGEIGPQQNPPMNKLDHWSLELRRGGSCFLFIFFAKWMSQNSWGGGGGGVFFGEILGRF